MKKIVLFIASCLVTLVTFAVDKEKIAKANIQTIDGMLDYALSLNNLPGATAEMDNVRLVVYCYAQLGYDLPTDIKSLSQEGTQVKKMSKLQPGDIVFFSSDQFGIVYKVVDGVSVNYLHLVEGRVMLSVSKGLSYVKGIHITSDKELNSIRKQYEAEQKAIQKATLNAEKAQKKAELEQAKAEKAKLDAEKAAQKAQEKIDRANADAEKAQRKVESANKKRDDLLNSND